MSDFMCTVIASVVIYLLGVIITSILCGVFSKFNTNDNIDYLIYMGYGLFWPMFPFLGLGYFIFIGFPKYIVTTIKNKKYKKKEKEKKVKEYKDPKVIKL